MPEDPLTSKIAKARDSVGRLCDFFAARRRWTLAPDASAAADDLVRAARTTDERLQTLILKAGAVPLPPADPDAEVRPDGVLDAGRISRFAAYLRELDAWFAAQPGPPTEPAGIIAVQRTQALLARTVALVDELLAPETGTDGSSTAEPAPTRTLDGPRQLVLDDNDERPMLQEFRNVKELTPECKELLNDFLSAWDIEQNSMQHKKFFDRVLRWISSAPEGQVLVIKVNTLSDTIEPYPAYVSREILAKSEKSETSETSETSESSETVAEA